MRTIVLNPESHGCGRSMSLGKLELTDSGEWGYFLGYDDRNKKVLIKKKDLEKVLHNNYHTYVIHAEIIDAREKVNPYKIMARFIPDKLKNELQSTGLDR